MTAIVGILNTQGIAIAADSAATISAQSNVKKVHNKGNKIFTLSKYHPVGIAIFNGANFMDVPWEILIKMYRKQLRDTAFDKVQDYKMDFLKFVKDNLHLVTAESKKASFYGFYGGFYNELHGLFGKAFTDNQAQLAASQNVAQDVQNLVNATLLNYTEVINNLKKNPAFNVDYGNYCTAYAEELDVSIYGFQEEIRKYHAGYNFTAANVEALKRIFHSVAHIENIFENWTGLVFIGYGEKEIFPSSHLVMIGMAVCDTVRCFLQDPVVISPGIIDGNILPYAQSDVTLSVLTGIDPGVEHEVNSSITSSFEAMVDALKDKLSKEEKEAVGKTSKELIEKLQKYRFEKITGPVLSMLNHMGKEDMAELAESLVNITSLKRKFSETNESVGGPVDVAVITKGDGFIWMKRKHYFDVELNKNFLIKYYK